MEFSTRQGGRNRKRILFGISSYLKFIPAGCSFGERKPQMSLQSTFPLHPLFSPFVLILLVSFVRVMKLNLQT